MVNNENPPPNRLQPKFTNPAAIGLCADCRHAQRIESSKGSEFLRCALSKSDARFAKYPRLPVLACAGHESKTA